MTIALTERMFIKDKRFERKKGGINFYQVKAEKEKWKIH